MMNPTYPTEKANPSEYEISKLFDQLGMKKVKIGDIVEIETSKGLAYAIYTHRHAKPPTFGALLRIFDQVYPRRPSNLEDLATKPIRFSTFFPLQAAVNKAMVRIVANVAVPKQLSFFPIFRSGTPDLTTKKVQTWWLWDGEKEWRIGNLSPEQRSLSFRSIWTPKFLVERIEEGWRPETDFR